jgi:hypothetical protein
MPQSSTILRVTWLKTTKLDKQIRGNTRRRWKYEEGAQRKLYFLFKDNRRAIYFVNNMRNLFDKPKTISTLWKDCQRILIWCIYIFRDTHTNYINTRMYGLNIIDEIHLKALSVS